MKTKLATNLDAAICALSKGLLFSEYKIYLANLPIERGVDPYLVKDVFHSYTDQRLIERNTETGVIQFSHAGMLWFSKPERRFRNIAGEDRLKELQLELTVPDNMMAS